MRSKVHVIAVAFENFGALKVFVQSWLNQTHENWTLTVIHDGPNEKFNLLMNDYKREAPEKIDYFNTALRFNDYGHSLREIGLKQIRGDYVLLTNADNYFIPKTIEYINEIFEQQTPDVVLYDMVHSHNRPGLRNQPAYSFFETNYSRENIDMSAAIVRASLAKKAGFRDKTFAGDATYFEDILRQKAPTPLIIAKIHRVFFVHN